MTNPMIAKLPALKISEVIDTVIGGPVVNLLLATGQTMAGRIHALSKDNSTVLLNTIDSEGRQRDGVAYVTIQAILAIEIPSAEQHLGLLGRGKIDPLDLVEAPGKLALTRELAALSEKLTTAIGKKFMLSIEQNILDSDDKKSLAAAHEVMNIFASAILALAADKMANDSIREKFDQAIIANSSKSGLEINNRTLFIRLPLQGGPNERFSKKALDTALNQML